MPESNDAHTIKFIADEATDEDFFGSHEPVADAIASVKRPGRPQGSRSSLRLDGYDELEIAEQSMVVRYEAIVRQLHHSSRVDLLIDDCRLRQHCCLL